MKRLAVLCALAPACSTPPAATTHDSPSSTTTMATAAFTLEYVTVFGPELGTGVQQYQSTLVVDGATGVATLDSVRAGSDAEGVPIGRFEATVGDAELADLSARAAAMTPGAVTQRGGPGTSTIILRYRAGSSGWEQSLNSNDPDLLAPFDPLLEPLNLMIGRLYQAPHAALGLEVLAGATPSAPFVVRLHNLGKVELAVLDPSGLGAADADAWAGVRIAAFPPEQPGVTAPPLEWQQVALEPSGGSGPRKTIVLAPGQHLDWNTRPWTPKAAGRQLVQAIIVDYAGDPTIGGRPHVRGALFSNALEHG